MQQTQALDSSFESMYSDSQYRPLAPGDVAASGAPAEAHESARGSRISDLLEAVERVTEWRRAHPLGGRP